MSFGIYASAIGFDMALDDVPMNLLLVAPVRGGRVTINLPEINHAETEYVVLPQPFGGDDASYGLFPHPNTISISGASLTYEGQGLRYVHVGSWAIYVYGRRK